MGRAGSEERTTLRRLPVATVKLGFSVKAGEGDNVRRLPTTLPVEDGLHGGDDSRTCAHLADLDIRDAFGEDLSAGFEFAGDVDSSNCGI